MVVKGGSSVGNETELVQCTQCKAMVRKGRMPKHIAKLHSLEALLANPSELNMISSLWSVRTVKKRSSERVCQFIYVLRTAAPGKY